jgi:pyruvate dehydrogenase E1 component alpha subunit
VSLAVPATRRALDLYERMLTVRLFEEAAYRAYESGEIAGTIHASIGQEAVAVGVIGALEPGDKVFTHHRGHGHALAKGVEPARLFGELFGRAEGASGGKGGSMHVTDTSVGFLGSMAVVGGSIPLAVGVALAMKSRGEPGVVVAFFGDGAVNQGILYESFNLAAIWQLPVLFVCENNGYAISVPNAYATSGSGIVARAQAFGIAAEQVDGQDVQAVLATASETIRAVRSGAPGVIEALTYRFVGHSRGDPVHGLYREQAEVESWRERDPLIVHRRAAGLSDDEVAAAQARVAAQIEQALAVARAYPEPEDDAAMRDVWGS